MPAFRRVEGSQAGPNALGILVPPGRRTVVIVRPRALAWDLLPLCSNNNGGPDTPFQKCTPGEAADLAHALRRALEEKGEGGFLRVEPVAAPDGDGYQVRAALGAHTWIACLRVPGQPYQPMVFATLDEALHAGESLTAVLCPEGDANQELYFNTRDFSR
jgi:hypothetical protein